MGMSMKFAQKIAYSVNTVMLSMVIGLWIFFKVLDVDFLVLFSIPTAMVYLGLYLMIYKEKLEIYLWTCYGWLTLYTGVTTICLGESYGFQLYCFSMIPCVYTVEYMSFKLGRGNVRSLYISIVIALFYLSFMGYLSINGPVYDTGDRYASVCKGINSITVFCYLVAYTNYLIRSIVRSETTLREIAHIDRLTGLYNRHYMLDKLSRLDDDGSAGILAIADIDDFKKINDTYGHNAGDDVLREISSKMTECCEGCDIARWGGEEFLILCRTDEQTAHDMLEHMRSCIGSEPIISEDSNIKVTVTVGMSRRTPGDSIDEWIHTIDKKLYIGKKSGKNTVVV